MGVGTLGSLSRRQDVKDRALLVVPAPRGSPVSDPDVRCGRTSSALDLGLARARVPGLQRFPVGGVAFAGKPAAVHLKLLAVLCSGLGTGRRRWLASHCVSPQRRRLFFFADPVPTPNPLIMRKFRGVPFRPPNGRFRAHLFEACGLLAPHRGVATRMHTSCVQGLFVLFTRWTLSRGGVADPRSLPCACDFFRSELASSLHRVGSRPPGVLVSHLLHCCRGRPRASGRRWGRGRNHRRGPSGALPRGDPVADPGPGGSVHHGV